MIEVNGERFTEDDVMLLRRREYAHTKRNGLVDLANRLARAMGLPESDTDPTYPDLRPS